MAVMIFYCPHCEQMFTGEGTAADKPACPHCGQAVQSTGYTKEEWIALTMKASSEMRQAAAAAGK